MVNIVIAHGYYILEWFLWSFRKHSIEECVFITVLPYALFQWKGESQYFKQRKTSSRKINMSSFYTHREQSEKGSFSRFQEAINKEGTFA